MMISRGKLRSITEVCADCTAPDPTWALLNRGILVCDECCSVHRSLGRHISQVKSLKKGAWCPSQLSMVHDLNSSGANSIWEYTLLDPGPYKSERRKPNAKDSLHPTKADFIRAKHQNLAFVHRPSKDEGPMFVSDLNKQLYSSVRTANLETSLRLLSLGADPNYIHPERGNTPLHLAAKTGQSSQVELLFIYGADPMAQNKDGKTPVDYARDAGHTDLVDRLIEYHYEVTDRLAYYLCGRKPDHQSGQDFIIPEMSDSLDLSEFAKDAKKKLQALPNYLFEELVMDVYDEVDRRENDAIWLSNQNHSALVTDRQIVRFLPVNPEFSSTRNQGRQKLAKFNAREFATLVIDILNEVKRRQLGSCSTTGATPRDRAPDLRPVLCSGNTKIDSAVSEEMGNLSDDEPLYDSVASDDESMEGNHKSLVEQKVMTNTDLVIGPPQETFTQVESGSEPVSKGSVSALLVKPTDLITEQIKDDRDVSELAEAVCQKSEKRIISTRDRPESFASSDQSDGPITLEEYLEVKKQLATSEVQINQLIQSNKDMSKEINLLQNMVQKLMQENSHLRSSILNNTSSSHSVSQHVPNGFEPPSGHYHPATGQKTTSDKREETSAIAFCPPRGNQRPQSMYEPRERPYVQQDQQFSYSWETVSPTDQKDSHAFPRDDSGIGNIQSSHSPRNSSEYDNTSISFSSNSPRQQSRSNSLSPSSESPPLSSEMLQSKHSLSNNKSNLPSREEIDCKTEQITKKIQELLISAQEGKHENFIPCSEKIFRAVTEIANIFPQGMQEDHIWSILKQLRGSASRLQTECNTLLRENQPPIDYRFVTQQVIQCAYDIAKTAKQLVTIFH
ncbi:ARF GTPase-activating protein GIT2-like isoform X2 [Tachypleus tridentatus]|uniref:ARF GTPase-activating protein GIT2-like isoform X2 n=1 Tax=Tachypleus tridentatus TaxID=6853 RepID=UPI003FCF0F80